MQPSNHSIIGEHPNEQFYFILLFEVFEVALRHTIADGNVLLDIVDTAQEEILEFAVST